MGGPAMREPIADREIVVSRVIQGSRRLVFEAYTDVRHLSRWWGSDGFTTTTHAFEFRPGGVWEFTMHGPDGTEYPNRIEWLEILPPERMVFRHGAKADDPEVFLSTVTLVDRGPASEVVLRSVFNSKRSVTRSWSDTARSRAAGRPSADWPPTWP